VVLVRLSVDISATTKQMNNLGTLADALAKMYGYHNPASEAYQLRNPGMLKAFLLSQPINENGYRIFNSTLDGYQALLFDLQMKCSGKSRSKLETSSTLRDLIFVYGQPQTAADVVANFLKHALHNETISEKTPLSFFLE
jgi:hypothetical protein